MKEIKIDFVITDYYLEIELYWELVTGLRIELIWILDIEINNELSNNI